jgi:hypothetical protein
LGFKYVRGAARSSGVQFLAKPQYLSGRLDATTRLVHILNAKFLSLIPHSHPSTEIVIDPNESSTTFDLDRSEGWVFRLMLDGTWRRVCWLPHKRRDRGEIACWGQKVVIGAASGIVTLLDFSNV